MKILLGHKIGMTQLWDDKGKLIAATVIKAEPNTVIREKDHVFVGTAVAGKVKKPQTKLAEKIGSKKGIWVKSVKEVADDAATLDVTQFEVGDKVAITGTTKGKGFAGTIKRHNFHRGPVSHGSDNVRRPGSIGAQRPQRVPKGQKMAGHMGAVQFTARGNKVLLVNKEENLLVLSGNVPGANRGKVIVKVLETK
jgi:large subunit ribosomal protein L3